MILEGIVTSLDASGELNVAPMGPIVDESMSTLLLRPFQTSRTYRNLKEHPQGVLHVTDDVLLLAKAAIGQLDETPETIPAELVRGRILKSACRWYEFEVEELDDSEERTRIVCRVVHSGRIRDFFGFHRARHAVLEAAILATRVHLLAPEEIRRQFAALAGPVEKTAGPDERAAFGLLQEHIEKHFAPAMTNSVTVTTGSRIHFGLLTHRPKSGREFGGAGVMVDSPGWRITLSRAESDSLVASPEVLAVHPDCLTRTEKLLAKLRSIVSARSAGSGNESVRVAVRIDSAIPAHQGLGSGSQLALAIARGFDRLRDTRLPVEELSRLAGRGGRSAIGTWGFALGGLLVDGGRVAEESVGDLAVSGRIRPAPLVARVDIPSDWRFVLLLPRESAGLSGADETAAFGRLKGMPDSATDRLCRIIVMQLVPSFEEAIFDEAAAAIGEYGRVAGEHFSAIQRGLFTHPKLPNVAAALAEAGATGLAQTSWGPGCAVLCRDQAMAENVSRLAGTLGEDWLETRIVRGRNRGADVDLT